MIDRCAFVCGQSAIDGRLPLRSGGLRTLVNGKSRLFAVDTVIVCAARTPRRALAERQVAGLKPAL